MYNCIPCLREFLEVVMVDIFFTRASLPGDKKSCNIELQYSNGPNAKFIQTNLGRILQENFLASSRLGEVPRFLKIYQHHCILL